jgi:AsmA-like C-terminal region/Protein of unknown function
VLRAGAILLGITAFVAVVAGVLAYVKLLHGPISLKTVASSIESSLNADLPGMSVKIEDAELRLASGGQLEIGLKNIRLLDGQNLQIAQAPAALVEFSWRALRYRTIAAERVQLVSPRINVAIGDHAAAAVPVAQRAREANETAPAAAAEGAGQDVVDAPLGYVELVKMLVGATSRARRREDAAAFLREFALTNATVIFDTGSRKSIWRAPRIELDFDHRKSRSLIDGRATIASLAGDSNVTFSMYEVESASTVELSLGVERIVPRGFARSLPQLSVLESVGVPLAGDVRLTLTKTGEILAGKMALGAGAGQLDLPWLLGTPLTVDGGQLDITYDGVQKKFDVAPSHLLFGPSIVRFGGTVTKTQHPSEGLGWAMELAALPGSTVADERGQPIAAVTQGVLTAFVVPERGHMALSQFLLKVADTEIRAEGFVTDMTGTPSGRLDGRVGTMPAALLKGLWPRALSPNTRAWVAQRVTRGQVQNGTFRLAVGEAQPGGGPGSRATVAFEGAGVEVQAYGSLPPLEIPRMLVRLEGSSLEINAPEAAFVLPEGRRVPLKTGRFTAVDLTGEQPAAELAVRLASQLGPGLELIERLHGHSLKSFGLNPLAVEGRLEGAVKAVIPLVANASAADLKIDGKLRIADGRARQLIGPFDVSGANLAFDISDKAIDAKGEMLVKGVTTKIAWQYLLQTPPEKQPPLRIVATLDANERTLLGLDVNDIVQGDVPVEIIVAKDQRGETQTKVRADLGKAELVLENVAWRKPPGRAAIFQFDLGKGPQGRTELQNVKLAGDDVAVEGWMALGPDNKLREFFFPEFSVNVVTRLEVQGKLRPDNVWEVKAKGPTYDGKDLFRSLFNVGQLTERPVPPTKEKAGLELIAEIDNVIGYSETSLRGVRAKVARRADKMTALEVRGTLDGGKPFVAELRTEAGGRRLMAQSSDAGQTLRLVGFYPNAAGGELKLETNLDGKGAADKTGTLWVTKFAVLGDPIVSEVVQSGDGSQPAIATRAGPRRGVARERIEFDRLRLPFSVGHGQFVMTEASIIGPLHGAQIRGKIDFKTRTLNVGGTYVPVSGLNSAIGSIPVLGQLLAGPRGEGVFGMTYAVNGPINDPQVIVNPLSLVTPGILREIFQMTPENPKVQPRAEPAVPQQAPAQAARASSSGPAAGSQTPKTPQRKAADPEIIGGWTSEAAEKVAPQKK